MIYNVEIKQSAKKSLAKIPRKFQDNLIDSIRDLSNNPRPQGSKKLTGRPVWRIRVGQYRVLYEIMDNELIITVVRVAHRKHSYQQKR